MDSLSIHPRVVNGRTEHRKVNTAKPHKGGGKLARKMHKLHTRRLDHAAIVKRLPPAQALGYRTPGSMNEHK